MSVRRKHKPPGPPHPDHGRTTMAEFLDAHNRPDPQATADGLGRVEYAEPPDEEPPWDER